MAIDNGSLSANNLIYPHFFKSLDKSYGGFKYRDSVSIGWNLVMQQFNCCGIYGYTDFMLSHSFHEKWREPLHSVIKEFTMNFSIACCNKIEINYWFQGPCRSKDYIHKRGCIEAFWDEADKYKSLVVTLVTISCLIQLVQIIVICYSRKAESNKVNTIKVETSAGN
ncbi:tetraspanin-18B-like [Mytilus edulis]|uniref:tetraspanin-18B-like n=1 Tax=Mytilus edulis TaxID=6550 RepID=UPI0039F11207